WSSDVCSSDLATHGGGGSYFGEIDIAVLAPSGKLLVIEQKNGGLSADNGQLVKRYGSQSKPVLSQIRRSLDALMRQWSAQHPGPTLALEYLIYLPDYRVHDLSAVGLQADRVLDRERSNRLPEHILTLLAGEAD